MSEPEELELEPEELQALFTSPTSPPPPDLAWPDPPLPPSDCDWDAACNGNAAGLRWWPEGQKWLVICADHIHGPTTIVFTNKTQKDLSRAFRDALSPIYYFELGENEWPDLQRMRKIERENPKPAV